MIKTIENHNQEIRREICKRFSDPDFMDSAIAHAAREAVRKHKLAGNPIATWRDGKVVIVQPEDIIVDEIAE